MPIPFSVGDQIVLKKKHPCGGDQFEIRRIGMDFKLRCLKCQSDIWLTRAETERRTKKILSCKNCPTQ